MADFTDLNDVIVDGVVQASGKLKGGQQATQSGDAVLLGSDLKIPTAFYDGGGGMQRVTYDSGQDFIDALKSTDGLYHAKGTVGELELDFLIFSDAVSRRAKKLPSYGYGCSFFSMSEVYTGVCATITSGANKITVYMTNGDAEELSSSVLDPDTFTLEAFLF